MWVPPDPGLPSTTSHAGRSAGTAFFWLLLSLEAYLWAALSDQSMRHMGAAGIRLKTLTSRVHDQIHVFHRHRSQQHLIAEHQSAHEAAAAFEIHPQRPT